LLKAGLLLYHTIITESGRTSACAFRWFFRKGRCAGKGVWKRGEENSQGNGNGNDNDNGKDIFGKMDVP
jgi:hypothetical protein